MSSAATKTVDGCYENISVGTTFYNVQDTTEDQFVTLLYRSAIHKLLPNIILNSLTVTIDINGIPTSTFGVEDRRRKFKE